MTMASAKKSVTARPDHRPTLKHTVSGASPAVAPARPAPPPVPPACKHVVVLQRLDGNGLLGIDASIDIAKLAGA
jgi:hypothetical protein